MKLLVVMITAKLNKLKRFKFPKFLSKRVPSSLPNYNFKKNSRQVNVNKICGGGGYFFLEIISLWGGGTLPKKVTILPNTYEKLLGQSDKQKKILLFLYKYKNILYIHIFIF